MQWQQGFSLPCLRESPFFKSEVRNGSAIGFVSHGNVISEIMSDEKIFSIFSAFWRIIQSLFTILLLSEADSTQLQQKYTTGLPPVISTTTKTPQIWRCPVSLLPSIAIMPLVSSRKRVIVITQEIFPFQKIDFSYLQLKTPLSCKDNQILWRDNVLLCNKAKENYLTCCDIFSVSLVCWEFITLQLFLFHCRTQSSIDRILCQKVARSRPVQLKQSCKELY